MKSKVHLPTCLCVATGTHIHGLKYCPCSAPAVQILGTNRSNRQKDITGAGRVGLEMISLRPDQYGLFVVNTDTDTKGVS